jgi:hypothetical protein
LSPELRLRSGVLRAVSHDSPIGGAGTKPLQKLQCLFTSILELLSGSGLASQDWKKKGRIQKIILYGATAEQLSVG